MSGSRTEKSTKTALASVLNNTVTKVFSFVLKTVFIKVFGRGMLGLNGLFVNVLTILCLADLGFGTAMAYSYYKPVAENDTKKIAALNSFYRKVYNIIAAAIAVIGICFIPFLDYFVNLDYEVEHLYLYYIIALANTVFSYIFAYKSTILTAHQQGYIMNNYYTAVSLVSMVAQVAVMLITKSYVAYLVVQALFTIINNLVVSRVVDKKHPYIKEKTEPLTKEDRQGIFKNMGSVFLYKFSSVMINSTDNILISKIVSTVAVGDYTNYLTVVNLLSGYVNIAFYSLTASLGNLMVSDSSEKQFRVFKSMQVMSAWFGIVCASCLYALINDFVVIWLGPDFVLDNLVVCAICINFFLTCLLNPIWVFREAAGLYLKTKYIMVITAVLNIGLSIIMGNWIGLAGIIFASAISRLLTYVWYEPILLFKDFFKKSVSSFFLPSLGITAVCFVMSYALERLVSVIPMSGIVGFAVKSIVCFGISNIIFLVIYLKNPYFKELLSRGKSLINKFLKRS